MLLAVLSVCSREELEDESSSSDDEAERAIVSEAMSPTDASARRQQIKNKILAVGRMQRMFQLLRYVTTPRQWTSFGSRKSRPVRRQRTRQNSALELLGWMAHSRGPVTEWTPLEYKATKSGAISTALTMREWFLSPPFLGHS